MRIFTKSVLTFLLLCVASVVGAQSFKTLTNGDRNWATTDGYPYYWMGDQNDQPNFCGGTATVQNVDGALEIYNSQEQEQNYSIQPFILDWFGTNAGEEYIVKIWLQADGDGSAKLVIGNWSKSDEVTLNFTQSDDFVLYQLTFKSSVTAADGEHILFQSGKFVGTIKIKRVQIGQIREDMPLLSKNGSWVSMINNGTADESDDKESFPLAHNGGRDNDDGGASFRPDIVDGGFEGKCFQVVSEDDPAQSWTTQFFVKANEAIPSGTEWRFSMKVKADVATEIPTGYHAAPRAWQGGGDAISIPTENEWVDWSAAGTSSKDDFQSLAFDLNKDAVSHTFNFDNIAFEKLVIGRDVRFTPEGYFQILFPRYTNIIRLVNAYADGRGRYVLPNSVKLFKVIVDGVEAPIATVEADITGGLYVFLDEEWALDHELTANNKVVIEFTNTSDARGQLLYIDVNPTVAVENFTEEAVLDKNLNILPDLYGQPYLMVAVPENNSFNLPTTLSEFKLTFDREILADKVEAKLGREALTVEPILDEIGDCKEIVLKRKTTDALAEGDITLTVTKVYAGTNLGDEDYATFTLDYTIGGGASEELAQQLVSAHEALDGAVGERYAGGVFTALDNAVTKYDAEAESYTAPTVVTKAILDLKEKTEALNNYKTLCDNYDNAARTLYTAYSNNAETKFNATEIYKQLAEAVATYHMGLNEEEVVVFDQFIDDAEGLAAAYAVVQPLSVLGDKMFCNDEESYCGGWPLHSTSGYAALHERLRRGVVLLQSLGVDESAEEIVAANAEFGDNDEIAAAIMTRATTELYKNLANAENTLFATTPDEDGNEITPSYDMTVFFKNPNCYAEANSTDVPGWTSVQGAKGNAWNSWGDDSHSANTPYPEDVKIHPGWHPNPSVMIEQSIENLPAGIYSITIEGDDNNSPTSAGTFGYVKTSDTLAPDTEAGETFDADIHLAAYTQNEEGGNAAQGTITDIEVTDGKLTVGYSYGRESQAFFNSVKVYLTAPSTTFNYASAYADIMTSIDAATPAKTRAIELYDMNGRRISTARKGIVIVKKLMSDGSVKTSKVIK